MRHPRGGGATRPRGFRAPPGADTGREAAACAQERIEKANGFVEDKRVNGTLAVARALGDFSFKREKKLSAEEQVGPRLRVASVSPP